MHRMLSLKIAVVRLFQSLRMHQLQYLHPQRLSQRLDGGDVWKAYSGFPNLKR